MFPRCYHLVQAWAEVWKFSRDMDICYVEFYFSETMMLLFVAAIYCSLRGFSEVLIAAEDTRHTIDADHATPTLPRT